MKRPRALMRFVWAHGERLSNETFCAACSARPTPRAPEHATFHPVLVLVRPVTIAPMVSLEDVGRHLVSAMPGVTERHRYGHRTWFVSGKSYLSERPFSKADIKRFDDATPPPKDRSLPLPSLVSVRRKRYSPNNTEVSSRSRTFDSYPLPPF